MSDQPTDTSKPDEQMPFDQAFAVGYMALLSLAADGLKLRKTRAEYLCANEAGNRAAIGLLIGFEGTDPDACEIFQKVFRPWLMDLLVFTPALTQTYSPELAAAAALLRKEFMNAWNGERTQLRLVKR